MLNLPPPVIDEPKQGSTHLANVRTTGTGAPGAFVELLDSNGGFLAKSPLIGASTRWEINYPWEPGPKAVRVIQYAGLVVSDRSSVRSFRIKPPRPVIIFPDKPIQGKEVLNVTNIHVGTVNLIMLRHGNVQIAGTFSGAGSTRTFTPANNWVPGILMVYMTQTVDSVESDPSGAISTTVKPIQPAINQLTGPVPVKQALTITDVYDSTASLKMFEEGGAEVAGTFSGTNTTRTFTPAADWAPGANSVYAVQTVNSMDSDRSDTRTFSVMMPLPGIDRPRFEETTTSTPTASGTGVAGAILTLRVGDDVVLTTEVKNDRTWSGTTSTLPPGRLMMFVVQTLNGLSSAPDGVVRNFLVKPPKPAITPPAAPAPANLQLNVTNIHDGEVILRMFKFQVGQVAGTFSGTGKTRTFIPETHWAAGKTTVNMEQVVDTVKSDASDTCILSIKPSKPAIAQPPNPAAAHQVLTVNDIHANATLKMFKQGGTEVAGEFITTGTTGTFTPAAAWAPGFTSVYAVQAVDLVASDPGDTRTFAVKPPKPAITQPPNPAPANQALTVTDVHEGNVTLTMFLQGGAEVAGTFMGSGLTRTFTPAADWAPGANSVYAVQTVNFVASDPGDTRTFAVQPPKLVVEQPPHPASARQELNVTDVHADVDTLKMFRQGGAQIAGTFSTTGAIRSFTPMADWAIGANSVYAVQTVKFVDSAPSDTRTFSVRMPLPVIDIPAHLEVTTPTPTASGTGVTGSTLTLTVGEDVVLTTEVKLDGTWSGVTSALPPGRCAMSVVQTMNGESSDPDAVVRNFRVKPPKPAIVQPPNPAAAYQVLTITGIHDGAVTLRMFKQGGAEVAGDFSTTGEIRTFTPAAPWETGTNTVFIQQTVDDVNSDPSDPLTFTVQAEDIPEQPKITLPVAYYQTSTRPTLEVIGLPGALITVRLDEGEVLCAELADPEGVMHYQLTKSLEPGDHSLDAKQKASEVESEWSGPHPFTVKNLPKTPAIEYPRHGSSVQQTLNIRGTGETRGQIQIRHEKDGEHEAFAEIKGLRSWRWDAQEPWPLGNYTILARQEEDGDSSSWTDARSFEVIKTRYGIGDSQPALGQPVIGTGQKARLRVQIVSGDTGEGAAGVTVEWRISGQSQVIATSVTNLEGWTEHLFSPDTAGEYEVLADLTRDNGDVVMVQPFAVKALLVDDWAQKGELTLDGKPVDLSTGNFALLSGQPHELEFKLKDGHTLDGASITLDDLWQGAESGVKTDPELGTPQVVETGKPVRWAIKSESRQTAYFGLVLKSPPLTDRELPGRVIGTNLNEEVEVFLDTFKQSFGKETAYPCLGATHTFSVKPGADSTLLGKHVTLLLSDEATALGVIVTPAPNIPVKLDEAGLNWTMDCTNSETIGIFSLRLHVQEWDISSERLPMLLAHNKVQITETSGPLQMGSGDWRYGIRATSFFTKQGADGVPVDIWISGEVPRRGVTDSRGWSYINYKDGASASLTIYNRYDGSNG
jgi:hypothetical protein